MIAAWLQKWMKWFFFVLGLVLPGAGAVLYLRGKKRGAEERELLERSVRGRALEETIRAHHETARSKTEIDQQANEQHAVIETERDRAIAKLEPTEADVRALNESIAELERGVVTYRSKH